MFNILRINRPIIEKIWSLENKFKIWTEIECLIAEKQAKLGIIPKKAAKDIRKKAKFSVKEIERLEKDIDYLEEKNGIPEFFVVPGENIISAKFEWSRVVSRRAERKCVTWQNRLEIKDSKVIVYLNRLSDLLWMLARDFEEDWVPSK